MSDDQAEPFYCPGCGREHKEEGRFCPLCGRDLKAYLDARRRDSMIGKVIDERYRVVKVIGRGGMGVVYHVEHSVMGKVMAMKLLNSQVRARPHAVRRFRQEIKVVSRLSHVHTVSVFDCGDAEDGSLYIVMEYLRGLDLEKLLQHEKVLPCERTARIARQVCSSLADAHAQGIVHRDIKPANIFLLRDQGEFDFVKVLDFGIAKLLEPGAQQVTEIGLIVGTPFYMAPEQARGSQGLGPATDIYSLGVVMYEMVTGQLPFKGKTVADFIEAHLRFEPMPPSTMTDSHVIDPEMEAIILRAMSKDPDKRFASIDAMKQALDGYLERQAQARAVSMSIPQSLAQIQGTHQTGGVLVAEAPRVTDHFEREHQNQTTPEALAPTVFDTAEPNLPTPQTPDARPIFPPGDEIPSEVLANRADWDRVERSWKRKRWMRRIVPLMLLTALLWLSGDAAWKNRSTLLPQYYGKAVSTAPTTQEQEPNNNILEATNIPIDKEVKGAFGRPSPKRPSDYDWYKVELPKDQPIYLSIVLTPPSFADVELGLYQLRTRKEGSQIFKSPQEVRTSNNNLRGGKESIPGYLWPGGTLYILVRELIVPGEAPQPGPYTLLVKTLKRSPQHETEPNEQFQQATPVDLKKRYTGYHDAKEDVDFFKFLAEGQSKDKVARCKLTFVQANRKLAPLLVLQDRQGRSLRPRSIRRRTVRVRLPTAPSKKRRRRRRRVRYKRERHITIRFRAKGLHFLRIQAPAHEHDKPYSFQITCR